MSSKSGIRLLLSAFVFYLFSSSLTAEVRLPKIFCDNLVLQMGSRIPVWGWAAPGEKVTVWLGSQRLETVADTSGHWRVDLNPLDAGGPLDFTVAGVNTIRLKNVTAGEVWIAGGQSNMAMQVRSCRNSDQEIASANYPDIRLFQVWARKAAAPLEDLEARPENSAAVYSWQPAGPETVGDFTAVGYFFARELYNRLGVPVGIISSNWGGTTAEAWISRDALSADPALQSILENWPDYSNDESWLKEQYADFLEQVRKAREEGKEEPLYFNQPAVLFNGMIAPLVPYAIRGVIWYQGESNVFRAQQYRDLFPALIHDWRTRWRRGDFPFLFVQLANYEAGPGNWPELREAQTRTLSLAGTGMAVIDDIGEANDIHPRNKQDVGLRLARAARAIVYGEKIVYSGPVYDSMQVAGNQVRLSFRHTGAGLVAGKGQPGLQGFTIAGQDRQFHPARAVIEGNQVVVSSDEVSAPASVRYGWRDNPEEANLYNLAEDGTRLPASPFRTDDWAGLTDGRR